MAQPAQDKVAMMQLMLGSRRLGSMHPYLQTASCYKSSLRTGMTLLLCHDIVCGLEGAVSLQKEPFALNLESLQGLKTSCFCHDCMSVCDKDLIMYNTDAPCYM